MKKCCDCETFKELSEFYPSKSAKDKLTSFCNSCSTIRALKYRVLRCEKDISYLNKLREYVRLYRKAKKLKDTRVYSTRKEYYNRRVVQNKAKKIAQVFHPISPEFCLDCDLPKAKLHRHHEDYSKPTEIVWLCSACHGARHRSFGPLQIR